MRTLTKRQGFREWSLGLGLVVAPAALGVILTQLAVGAGTEVNIGNFAFTPTELAVQAGTTVVFRNRDDTPHSVVGAKGEVHSKAFDVDDTFEFTVAKAGGVGPAARHKATGLLNEKFLTSTGQTVPRPGASQGAGATDFDRRIEQQNDRIEQSICGNCN